MLRHWRLFEGTKDEKPEAKVQVVDRSMTKEANWSRHHVDKPDGLTDKEFEMNKRRAFLLYTFVQKILLKLGVTVDNGFKFPRDMIDELLIHPVYISWNIHNWVARDRADSGQPTKIQQMVMDCLSLQPSKTQSGKDQKTQNFEVSRNTSQIW
jgi:hypothetical protein